MGEKFLSMERYNHLNQYLKEKFGNRTLKICVDGNFSCPNRDGTKGKGGCIFCGAYGAGENIKGKLENTLDSIKNQVQTFLNSYRGERAEQFIVYFQAFSGTYDDIKSLKEKYDTALSVSEKIIGLEIATRPDLINEEIVGLLKSYKEKYYVCVELGLQTANEKIGEEINRCYTNEDFLKASKMLKENDIEFVAHLMVGLPDEKEEDILETINLINSSGAKGIKIHNTYVLKNTLLEKLYLEGKYLPITQDYYAIMVAKILKRLRPDIIIHRITGDPPKNSFVAPEWATHKKIVLNAIERKLKEENIYQGDLYK